MAKDEPQRSKQDRNGHEANSNTNEPIKRSDRGPASGRLSHEDVLKWSLWRILVQHTHRRGAKVIDVLDTAEERGIDRFWATEMLMFWLGRGDIRRSYADSRVVPQSRWWRR